MKLNIFITIIFSQLLLSQNAVEYKNIVFNDDQLYCFLEDKYILSKKVFLNIKLNYDSLKSINCNKYMIYKKEYYCYENSTLFSGIAREYKKNGTIKRQY